MIDETQLSNRKTYEDIRIDESYRNNPKFATDVP